VVKCGDVNYSRCVRIRSSGRSLWIWQKTFYNP